jgi:hypothetical protein
MGRGRAKAKQTKVARDLKYRSYSTDFTSLERELRGGEGEAEYVEPAEEIVEAEVDEVEDDQYADLASRYNSDDDVEPGDFRRIS